MTERPVRFYVESLGCAKNQVDSEEIIGEMLKQGFTLAAAPEAADFIIVNSCGFIRPAKTESIETTLELRALHPGARIILAGCLSQRYEAQLRSELPEVDAFAGNRDPGAVVEIARELVGKGAREPPGSRRYRRSPLNR